MQIFSHAVPTQHLPQLHPPEAGSVGGALIGRPCVFLCRRGGLFGYAVLTAVRCIDQVAQPQESASHTRAMA